MTAGTSILNDGAVAWQTGAQLLREACWTRLREAAYLRFIISAMVFQQLLWDFAFRISRKSSQSGESHAHIAAFDFIGQL